MQITKLKLVNYRSFSLQEFYFSNYKNIIIGNNGKGKTNIVEAIYYLALTKSFRTNDDSVLINTDSEIATIEGTIRNRYSHDYKAVINKNGKKVFINKDQIKRLSDYISKINVILFTGEDLKLIKDSPSVHRKLINMEISQLNNEYLKLLSQYNKILKQRNTYLKSMMLNSMIPKEYLDVLTDKLVEYGLKIFEIRSTYINSVNNYLDKNFKKITKREGLSLKYISDYTNLTKEEILKKYSNDFKRDMNYNKTHRGIHLDDFIFYFNDHLAKDYLSEGEQKNAVISFKLSEINIFYNQTKTMPILILDDLFSELDNEKINRIIRFFKKNIQIFITTTDLDNVDKRILSNSKVFNLKETKIEVKDYE